MIVNVISFVDFIVVEFVEYVICCGEGILVVNGVFVVKIGECIGCFLKDCFIV